MESKQLITIDQSNCLKGIFAISILIHHIFQLTTIDNGTFISIVMHYLGFLGIALFFFLTGYGLYTSLRQKPDYISNFPKKRLLPFYCQVIFFMLVYILLNLIKHGGFDLWKILTTLTVGSSLIGFGWFFQDIFVVYLLFYLTFRFIKNRKAAFLTFTALIVVFSVVCQILNIRQINRQFTLPVALGMLFCHYEDKIADFLKNSKHYWFLVLSLLALFCLNFIPFAKIPLLFIVQFVLYVISSSAFCLIIVLLIQKVRITFAVTRFLGKYFLEIYAFQSVVFNICAGLKPVNELLYIIVMIIGTVLLAVVVHPVVKGINTLVKGEKIWKK